MIICSIGTLPVRWSQMTSLLLLTASFNRLKGALPSQWSNMRRLQALALADNLFTVRVFQMITPSFFLLLQKITFPQFVRECYLTNGRPYIAWKTLLFFLTHFHGRFRLSGGLPSPSCSFSTCPLTN